MKIQDYINPENQPKPPVKPTLYSNFPSKEEIEKYAVDLDKYQEDYECYERLKKAHSLKTKELLSKFKDALHEHYGDGLSKEAHEIVCAKAWDDGHSSGLQSVQYKYEELADMALKLIKLKD